jgi:hypothetical protein
MDIRRLSPIQFEATPVKTIQHDDWEVVASYSGEREQPALVDLSHINKWEVQTKDVTPLTEEGFQIPDHPGDVAFSKGMIISRLTSTRLLIWDLSCQARIWSGTDGPITEITDGQCLLFLSGERLFSLMRRVTRLDIQPKIGSEWSMIQGPILGIGCKTLVHKNPESIPGAFVGTPRGFGQSLADGLLKGGLELGWVPAGEGVFTKWWQQYGQGVSYKNGW